MLDNKVESNRCCRKYEIMLQLKYCANDEIKSKFIFSPCLFCIGIKPVTKSEKVFKLLGLELRQLGDGSWPSNQSALGWVTW
jgi:hypothetical protein